MRSRCTGLIGIVVLSCGGLAAPAAAEATLELHPGVGPPGTGTEVGPEPVVGAGLTQEHFDARHTGSNPREKVLTVSNVADLERIWSTNRPIKVQGTVLVSRGIVFAGGETISDPAQGRVYALDARTGSELWRVVQPAGSSVTGIGICCGLVFAGTLGDHALHAYDANTGIERWTFHASGAVSGPTVVGSRLFVQDNSGDVTALDGSTGTVLWQAAVSSASSSAAPAVASGVVFVAEGNRVRSFRARDGQPMWTRNLPSQAFSSPTVVNGVVYEAVLDAGLYALSASTGATLWHQPTGEGIETTPTVDESSVYVGDVDGKVYSFDRVTGSPGWVTPLGWRFVLNTPIQANGVIYAATDALYSLDATTGSVLWSAATDLVNTDPAVIDGHVYVGDFAGNIAAYGLP